MLIREVKESVASLHNENVKVHFFFFFFMPRHVEYTRYGPVGLSIPDLYKNTSVKRKKKQKKLSCMHLPFANIRHSR